jgi:hypothetical protein
MKQSSFRWAYDSEINLRRDPKMNRELLSKLIRSWRRNGFIVTRKRDQDKTIFRVNAGGLIAFSELSK